MAFSLSDRGTYYRGLLVLVGRDRIVEPRERELLLEIGKILDFSRSFCEAAIDDLLRNPHLTHDPIVLSDPRIAECFLRDAIRLALVDDDVHDHELIWLKKVARANGLSEEWLSAELAAFDGTGRRPDALECLELRQHV